MPYIRKEEREKIDDMEFYKKFINMPYEKFVGSLAYLIYKIVVLWLIRNGKRFYSLAGILGAISEVRSELRRRILVPYEKSRKVENGDI